MQIERQFKYPCNQMNSKSIVINYFGSQNWYFSGRFH